MKDGKNGDILFDIRHLSHTFETEEGKKFDALSDVTASIGRDPLLPSSVPMAAESLPWPDT